MLACLLVRLLACSSRSRSRSSLHILICFQNLRLATQNQEPSALSHRIQILGKCNATCLTANHQRCASGLWIQQQLPVQKVSDCGLIAAVDGVALHPQAPPTLSFFFLHLFCSALHHQYPQGAPGITTGARVSVNPRPSISCDCVSPSELCLPALLLFKLLVLLRLPVLLLLKLLLLLLLLLFQLLSCC